MHKRLVSAHSAAALILTLSAMPLSAQAPVPAPRPAATGAWVDLGLSAGTYGSWGAAIGFTRVGASRPWRVRAHVQGNEGWTLEPGKTIRTFGELSLQFGKPVHRCGQAWCAIYLGPAYVESTVKRYLQPLDARKTLGLSAEALIVSANAPHLTFGGFANLNAAASYAGVMLSVSIGKFPHTRRPNIPIPR